MDNDIIWKPSPEAIKQANISQLLKKSGLNSTNDLIQKSGEDIEWFWDLALKDLNFIWQKPYTKIIEGTLPFASWFIDGQINIIANILDKHLNSDTQNKTAFIWEGDCGAVKKVSYGELASQVERFAAGLKKLGLNKGDRVALYMPMIPEMIVSFLATLKIGAVIVPIFSGFGPEPAAIRIQDAGCKIVITSDYALRRGKKIETKKQVDQAIAQTNCVEHVIIAKRLFEDIPFIQGRDIWFDDVMSLSSQKIQTETLDAEHHSLIIYTSGTTGKPKGCVHTHAGALAQIAKEVTYYMDCKKDDVFFWVTDIGWMMGPWEIIGTFFNGATLVIFEGAPDYPKPDRLWDMIERHQATILGISPTAIRLLKKFELSEIKKHDLSKLRILGSTGEAWDPESYQWYFEHVGGKRCPIINISGGTEIIGCHLSPLPTQSLKSCTLGGPGLGMAVDVFNEEGQSLREEVGYLVCKKPAPSMTKGFLGDKQRYLDTYFSKWPTIWNHGDWAVVDADGYWFLRGRADDVIKVSGHRTGPAEIESALMTHKSVAECAAIGVPHAIKGESIVCFAVLKEGFSADATLQDELKKSVSAKLGKTLTPDEIRFVKALPKTRSAKIVRGAIKKKFLGLPLGDISSVENPDALEAITL